MSKTEQRMKLTKAQKRFLAEHTGVGYHRHGLEDGVRPRHLRDRISVTYDFIGRVRDLGLIDVIDGKYLTWPYGWEATRITDAGRAAIAAAETSP